MPDFPSLENHIMMWGLVGVKDMGRTEETQFLVVRRNQGPICVEMARVEDVSLVRGVLAG